MGQFIAQFAGSLAGVMVLVALAAWARIPKPTSPLGEGRARELLAEEFPDQPIEAIYLADDGRGAIARSGSIALVLAQAGDGYFARTLGWTTATGTPRTGKRLRLVFDDVAAPQAQLLFSFWPPVETV